MIATRLSSGQLSTRASKGSAEFDEPAGLRHRRREDVGVHRHDRQIRLRSQRDDRAGDAVVDAEFVAERQVEPAVQALPQNVRGQVLLSAQCHPGQSELAFLVVEVRIEERRLPDQELRHVVEPELVEMITAHHDEHVRCGPGEGVAESFDLRHPLVGERRSIGAGRGARPVVERVMGGRDHRCHDGHELLLPRVLSVSQRPHAEPGAVPGSDIVGST